MGDSLAKATGDEKGLGFTNDFVNFEVKNCPRGESL